VHAIETIDEDDGPVEVVEAVCRRVWPLSSLAAAVPDNHIVLSWSADGAHAACQACVVGYRGRGGYWSRAVDPADVGLERRVPDRTGGGRSRAGGVVTRWGDRQTPESRATTFPGIDFALAGSARGWAG